MSIVEKEIIDYLQQVQPMCKNVLGEIQAYALRNKIPIIPPETANFLKTILSIKQPNKILEVGCAIGFSAGLMSEFLKDDGHITTIDRFDIMIRQAKENFKKMQIEDKVTLLEGDATEILPTLTDKFDLIFLDCAKGQYISLLADCLRLLNKDGILIADDVLQNGNIALNKLAIPRRQRTIHGRMQNFLHALLNSDGLITSILPIGDGLSISHKTKDNIEIEVINLCQK